MSHKEKNLINKILVNLPDNERLFRANSGMAWVGTVIGKTPDTITLKNARPFFGMIEGTPDLIGWREIIITPDMIGSSVAQFQAVECKTGNLKLSDAQKKFRDVLVKMGGAFREWRE